MQIGLLRLRMRFLSKFRAVYIEKTLLRNAYSNRLRSIRGGCVKLCPRECANVSPIIMFEIVLTQAESLTFLCDAAKIRLIR
jgi:hypothetical protein